MLACGADMPAGSLLPKRTVHQFRSGDNRGKRHAAESLKAPSSPVVVRAKPHSARHLPTAVKQVHGISPGQTVLSMPIPITADCPDGRHTTIASKAHQKRGRVRPPVVATEGRCSSKAHCWAAGWHNGYPSRPKPERQPSRVATWYCTSQRNGRPELPYRRNNPCGHRNRIQTR